MTQACQWVKDNLGKQTVATPYPCEWVQSNWGENPEDMQLPYPCESLEAYFTTQFTVTYDVNGGTGTIEPQTVQRGYTITLDDGADITPPTDKEFVGWATTKSATTPDVESSYVVTQDVTLYAVYDDVVTPPAPNPQG